MSASFHSARVFKTAQVRQFPPDPAPCPPASYTFSNSSLVLFVLDVCYLSSLFADQFIRSQIQLRKDENQRLEPGAPSSL